MDTNTASPNETDENAVFYSASQIVTFMGCNRKWSWERIYKYRSPPTESQQYGTKIHGQLEHYVEDSEVPDDPRALEVVRNAATPFNNGPVGVWRTESYFAITLPRPDPAEFPNGYPTNPAAERRLIGYIDLEDENPKEPEVVDYKTMKDLKWAKTEFELVEDVQLNIYAKSAFIRYAPNAKNAWLTHVQIATIGAAKSQKTSVVVDRDHVEKSWQRYLRIVDQIEGVRALPIERVALNRKECEKYGGCPHLARCNAVDIGFPVPINPNPPLKSQHHKQRKEETLPINPPDSTRRPEGSPGATIDSVAPENRPRIKGTKKTEAANGTAPSTSPRRRKKETPVTQDPNLAALNTMIAQGQTGAPVVERPPLTPQEAFLNRQAGTPPIQMALPQVQAPVQPPPPVQPQYPQYPGYVLVQGPQGPMYVPETALQPPQPPAPSVQPQPQVQSPVMALPQPQVQPPVMALPQPPPAPAPQVQVQPPAMALPPPNVSLPIATTDALRTDPLVREPPANGAPAHPGVPFNGIPVAGATPPAEETPRRGRPRGSKNKKTSDANTPANGAEDEVGPQPNIAAVADGELDLLLIDAIPVFGHENMPAHLSTFLAPICAKIRESTGLDWQLHEFRKGTALLTDMVRTAPLPPILIVDSQAPMAKIVLEVLIPRAKTIIQGT